MSSDRTAKALAQAKLREKKKDHLIKLERRSEEYDAIRRKLQEMETLLDAVQTALGITRKQLESFPAFLMRAWQAEYGVELAKTLASLSKLRVFLIQFEGGTPLHKTISHPTLDSELWHYDKTGAEESDVPASPTSDL